MDDDDEHEGIVKNLLPDWLLELPFPLLFEHEVFEVRVQRHEEYHFLVLTVLQVDELNELHGEEVMGEYEVMVIST